jgi:GT2 family glycosyltransferase
MTSEIYGADSVSIIVVNFNGGLLLSHCIAESLKQACEVIVVDNDSTDDSMNILETTFSDDPQFISIRNNKNIGFASGCTIGAGLATKDYLLFLNPDCLLQKNSVEKLFSNLKSTDDVGMTGGLLINPDGTEQGGGRRAIPTPWRSFVRAFGLTRFADRWPKLFFDFHLHKQPLPDQPLKVEAISGACMMMKGEVLESVGHWDESYFLHCEDLDLCMRFRLKGWGILFVPDAVVVHHLGVCSRSRPIFVEWHKHKGMMRFYGKFFKHQYPGLLMWLVAIGVWFRFCAVLGCHISRRISEWLSFGKK